MQHFPLIDQLKDYDAVVLADGAFPSASTPLQLLERAPLVVCCDGAARHIAHPDVIVGDGDSVPAKLRDRLIRIDEQDDNDLTKATRYCLKRGLRRIVYLGATGLREDHTLGNIALMARYQQEFGIEPVMATDHGWLVAGNGDATFDSIPRQQVSIFNIDCQRLSSVGLRWQAYPYHQLWQGTLNEATSHTFSIKADGSYLVYRTYAAKHL